MGPLNLYDLFGGPHGHDLPATITSLGAEIDDVIGTFDHFHVVLDDNDGVALIHELVKHYKESLNVVEVETRGGLIEDKKGSGLLCPGYMGSEFQPLGLAAREGCQGLAQAKVIQTDEA